MFFGETGPSIVQVRDDKVSARMKKRGKIWKRFQRQNE
jgi:hypothetical protein